jgi:hypothetical protein
MTFATRTSTGTYGWASLLECLGPKGTYRSLYILDFGGGWVFTASDFELEDKPGRIVARIDPEDREQVRSAVLKELTEGYLPEYFQVSDLVDRETVFRALYDVFSEGYMYDWDSVAEVVEERGPQFAPNLETKKGREELLAAYLDTAMPPRPSVSPT